LRKLLAKDNGPSPATHCHFNVTAHPCGSSKVRALANTKSKVFQDEILAGPEGAEQSAQQVTAHDHDEILSNRGLLNPLLSHCICK
jgi:hypothetical protein